MATTKITNNIKLSNEFIEALKNDDPEKTSSLFEESFNYNKKAIKDFLSAVIDEKITKISDIILEKQSLLIVSDGVGQFNVSYTLKSSIDNDVENDNIETKDEVSQIQTINFRINFENKELSFKNINTLIKLPKDLIDALKKEDTDEISLIFNESFNDNSDLIKSYLSFLLKKKTTSILLLEFLEETFTVDKDGVGCFDVSYKLKKSTTKGKEEDDNEQAETICFKIDFSKDILILNDIENNTSENVAEAILKPLKCKVCGSVLALGTEDSVKCRSCGTEQKIPDDYIQLRNSRNQFSKDKEDAEKLYIKIGKPPSAFINAWNKISHAIIMIILFIPNIIWFIGSIHPFSALVCFLVVIFGPVYLSEFLINYIHINLVDVYSGGGLYLIIGGFLICFLIIPKLILMLTDDVKMIRKSLLQTMSAKGISIKEGKAQCRNCGASLDIPKDSYGVRCIYCNTDNIVSVSAENLSDLKKSTEFQSLNVVAAYQKYNLLKKQKIKKRLLYVGISILALLPLWLTGYIAESISNNQPVAAPYWRTLQTNPPNFISVTDDRYSKKVMIPEEKNTIVKVFDERMKFWVALHYKDVIEIKVANDKFIKDIDISNFEYSHGNFNFSGYNTWKYTAPYTGIFVVSINSNGIATRYDEIGIKWNITKNRENEISGPKNMKITSYMEHVNTIHKISFPPYNQAQFASAATDGKVCLWDISCKTPKNKLPKNEFKANSIVYSPDGSKIATGYGNGQICIYDSKTLALLNSWECNKTVFSMEYNKSGSLLSIAFDSAVNIYETKNYSLINTLKGNNGTFHPFCFHPSAPLFFYCGEDSMVCIWNVITNKKTSEINCKGVIWQIQFIPEKQLLAVVSGNKIIFIDVSNPRLPKIKNTLRHAASEEMFSCAVCPGGKIIATSDNEYFIKIWDVETGKLISIIENGKDNSGEKCFALEFSNDGKHLAAGYKNGEINLYSVSKPEDWKSY